MLGINIFFFCSSFGALHGLLMRTFLAGLDSAGKHTFGVSGSSTGSSRR